MKKSLVARGFIGAVASLLGVAAVGCGADVGDGAAGDSAEIGSTSEALTLSGNAKKDIHFFGSIKLDSAILNSNGNADNLELIVGGMDAAGNPQVHVQVYDRQTDTLTRLRTSAPADISLTTALVEPVIAKIPNTTNAYLIAGGRTARDGTPSADSYVLKLNLGTSAPNVNKILNATLSKIATASGGTLLPAGVVFTHKSIKQCGLASNQQLIAFGGVNASNSFHSMSNKSATRDILVFTYDATTPAASDWAPLKDTSTPAKSVLLREANGRGYYEVLTKSTTDFFVAGGLNSGFNAMSSVDYVKVSSSCVADANQVESEDSTHVKVKAATAMPGALARFASIQTEPYTVSGVTYDFVVAGGNDTTIADGTALPVATYQFDPDNTTSCGMGCTTQGIWTTIATSIQAGRTFPRFVAANRSGASTDLDGINLPTVVKLATGYVPRSTLEATDAYYNTSLLNDVFTTTAAPAAWSAGTSFQANEDRVGSFGDLLKNNAALDPVMGLGAQHVNTTGVDPAASGTPQTVITVP